MDHLARVLVEHQVGEVAVAEAENVTDLPQQQAALKVITTGVAVAVAEAENVTDLPQ